MMRPFLIFGNTDKNRFDFAKKIAEENHFLFEEIDTKNFETELYKPAITSSLTETLRLYYIPNCDTFFDWKKKKRVESFLNIIKGSPHRFILSTNNILRVHYLLRNSCILKSLGEEKNPITESLKLLSLEPNRVLVHNYLSHLGAEDFHILIKILSENAWRSPVLMDVMEKVNQNLYKTAKEYIISLLSFTSLIPPFSPNFRGVDKQIKLARSILRKIQRAFKLPTRVAVDTFYFWRKLNLLDSNLAFVLSRRVGLDDMEKKFMGIVEVEPPIPSMATHTEKVSGLSDFF